eukprot:2933899-Pyramimonas_sp.AAC.1
MAKSTFNRTFYLRGSSYFIRQHLFVVLLLLVLGDGGRFVEAGKKKYLPKSYGVKDNRRHKSLLRQIRAQNDTNSRQASQIRGLNSTLSTLEQYLPFLRWGSVSAIHTLQGHSSAVFSNAFSPSGAVMV